MTLKNSTFRRKRDFSESRIGQATSEAYKGNAAGQVCSCKLRYCKRGEQLCSVCQQDKK